jgi:cytochrome c556
MPSMPRLLPAFLLALAAAPALADSSAEQVIEHRIAGFRDIGTAFKNINDELKAPHPDAAKIASSSRLILEQGSYIANWFPPGSEAPPKPAVGWIDRLLDWFESGDAAADVDSLESHAKPEIWLRPAEFEAARMNFERQAHELQEVCSSGDLVRIAAQHRKLGETCKSCHRDFRKPID